MWVGGGGIEEGRMGIEEHYSQEQLGKSPDQLGLHPESNGAYFSELAIATIGQHS